MARKRRLEVDDLDNTSAYPLGFKKPKNFVSAGSAALSSSIVNLNFTLPTVTTPRGNRFTSPGNPSGPAILPAQRSDLSDALTEHSRSSTRSTSSSPPAQVIEVDYPSIRESAQVLSGSRSGLTGEQVEKIFTALESMGICTVDEIRFVANDRLEDIGVPSHVIDLYKDECRRDELLAEGGGVSAPREFYSY